jgi:hypothetical protein
MQEAQKNDPHSAPSAPHCGKNPLFEFLGASPFRDEPDLVEALPRWELCAV